MPRSLIAYYRVSTKRQGVSGLGLDAQREAVAAYARRIGAQITQEFTEVESGSKNSRPELARAVAAAKATGATLVVAKLDRLARNVAFTSALMEAGCDFVACDNPTANRLTIHILAAVAEYEVEQIRARIKAALAQAKKRGTKLGAANPACRGKLSHAHMVRMSLAGMKARRGRLEEFKEAVLPVIRETLQLERRGGTTFTFLANRLNYLGYRGKRGAPWTLASVKELVLTEIDEPELKANLRYWQARETLPTTGASAQQLAREPLHRS